MTHLWPEMELRAEQQRRRDS